MDITAISDLHGHYPKLEGGDLLIVAGDLTKGYFDDDIYWFDEWLRDQNYKKKIVVAGNHDNELIGKGYDFAISGAMYLCDSGTEFEGLKIWGSPWTAYFNGMNPKCMAFTINVGCDTDQWLAEKWALIPDDIDILITHSPPHGILDTIGQEITKHGIIDIRAGSKSLRDKVYSLKKLKLHCFGHIHEGYNKMTSDIKLSKKEAMRHPTFVNASHVNKHYWPVNKPIRIEL